MHALLQFARRKADPARPVLAPVPELQDAQLAAGYYDHRVGGDCYAFHRPNPHRVLFALIDVAGRSEENRPVVAAVQSALPSLGSALLAGDNVNEAESMGTVSYFNAGHTPGLLRDGSRVIELRATGLPLGLFSHATPDASIVALEPGDALVVVSRGVVEARHKRREFGLEQVMSNLLRAQAGTAPQICSDVLADLREFTRKPEAQNDVTILALARKSAAKAAGV